jgi:hypothetical protein
MCDDQRRLATALDYYLDHGLDAGDPERSAYQQLRDARERSEEADSAVRRLLGEVERAGLSELDLDEVVHDCDERASNINNQGLEAQIAFMVEMLGVEDAQRTLRAVIASRTPAVSGEVA